jgi:acetylglutamate kinase
MRPLVIKLGGALLDDARGQAPFFAALAGLIRREASVILVHGGGAGVDRHLARLGLASEKRDGIRITPPAHMEEIAGVLAGRMNARLVGALRAMGVNAVGLTLADGGTAEAVASRRFAFDAGRVGEVTGGDPHLAHTLLRAGCTPVYSSIAMDAQGGLLNVNADDAAAAVARIVRAARLVLLTDVPGVLDASGAVLPELDRAAVERLARQGAITGGMLAKVRGALQASSLAGVPTLVAGWAEPRVIESLADGRGIGTVFHPELEACHA